MSDGSPTGRSSSDRAAATAGLCKSYGRRPVLHDVNLDVPVGSCFGFLGPNGAGKTTTIRILLGLLRATSGGAEVFSRDAWSDGPEIRAEIGYLPGDVRFQGGLTGRATLEFLNSARGGRADSEIVRLTRRFDLDLDKRVRSYSRGMKQKLGLIQAMMHRPRLLILDEPTVALDPLVREVLYDELRDVTGGGRTVLFSSHTLSEVEELCDRVAILRDGRLIEQETIETLRRRAVRRVEVTFTPQSACPNPPDHLDILRRDEASLSGAWRGPVDSLLAWLAQAPVSDVSIAPPDLENLFLAYYDETEKQGDGRAEAGT